MGKHRVYEIAKELGKTNQEVIDILAKNNIQVKSTLSTVDDTVRDLVVKNSARKPVQEKKAFLIVKKRQKRQSRLSRLKLLRSRCKLNRIPLRIHSVRSNNRVSVPTIRGNVLLIRVRVLLPLIISRGRTQVKTVLIRASASRIVLTTNKVSAHSNSRGNVLIPKIKVRGLIKTVLTRALIRKIVPIINRDNARSRETDRSSVLRGAFI